MCRVFSRVFSAQNLARERPDGPVVIHSYKSGADAKALLQGLITNDMSLLDEGAGRQPCISAAFLNPKVDFPEV